MTQRRVFSTAPKASAVPRPRYGVPGARMSPQMPGQVPDRSGVPGHGQLPIAAHPGAERPLTQFGTAEEIVGVYAVDPNDPEQATNPARFEQAAASYEEMRKADPSLLTPVRPRPGYDLAALPHVAAGEAAPGEIPALAEGTALTADKSGASTATS
jgi:hypothetical protein